MTSDDVADRLDRFIDWFLSRSRWLRVPLGLLLLPFMVGFMVVLTVLVAALMLLDRPLARRL